VEAPSARQPSFVPPGEAFENAQKRGFSHRQALSRIVDPIDFSSEAKSDGLHPLTFPSRVRVKGWVDGRDA
jgi:hypothetical protein